MSRLALRPFWFGLILILLAASLPTSVDSSSPVVPERYLSTVQPSAAGSERTRSDPRVVVAEPARVVFEIDVPFPRVQDIVLQGQTFQQLIIDGYREVGQPGQPALPEKAVLVGAPPTGDLALRILDYRVEELAGRQVIAPAPDYILEHDAEVAGIEQTFAWDRQAYFQDVFIPEEVVALAEEGFVRQQRLVRLAIRPVQYNPATGRVRVYRYLRVEVQLPRADFSLLEPPEEVGAASSGFEALLAEHLLNYDQARQWRASRGTTAGSSQVSLPDGASALMRPAATSERIRLTVREAGVYAITLADLQAVGIPAVTRQEALNPELLQLWRQGQQVAADFLGDADTLFEEDEALVFYAPAPSSPYTRDAVYWLVVGAERGLRMATLNGRPQGFQPEASYPTSVHLEKDLFYRPDSPPDGDPGFPRWYWHDLMTDVTPVAAITVPLPDLAIGGSLATLRVALVGFTDIPNVSPDHQVSVEVNGQWVGDVVWNGEQPAQGEFQFPASHLIQGDNIVRLFLPGSLPNVVIERAFVDWIELEYRGMAEPLGDSLQFQAEGPGYREFDLGWFQHSDILVYDVTNTTSPQRVANIQAVLGQGTPKAGRAGPEAMELLRSPTTGSLQSNPRSDLHRRLFLPAIGAKGGATDAYRLHFGLELQDQRHSFIAVSSERVRPAPRLALDQDANLRSIDHQADYLLITHSDFMEAAQELAEYRRTAASLSVMVIDVQDIYDEFSGGDLDPGAIRDFVSYAYHSWQAPAPAYVLLLGDGHYDYREVTTLAQHDNYIPPYIACFDPWLCEVASDNEFVAVSGDDRLPDLAIGRLTATDPAAAAHSVDKIIAYETVMAPALGMAQDAQATVSDDWLRTFAFVADNARDASGRADRAGDFELITERVIELLPQEVIAERVYYDPYAEDDQNEPFRQRTVPEMTGAIIDAVNAGSRIVNYTGHAAINVWAHEWLFMGASRLLRNDVYQLANQHRLAVFLDMACLSGNFADIQVESLQETLLDWHNGGSVAGWAATGFGVATGHDALQRGFYEALFETGLEALGPATVAGKLNLWQEYGHRYIDLQDTFGLIGDPALQLAGLSFR